MTDSSWLLAQKTIISSDRDALLDSLLKRSAGPDKKGYTMIQKHIADPLLLQDRKVLFFSSSPPFPASLTLLSSVRHPVFRPHPSDFPGVQNSLSHWVRLLVLPFLLLSRPLLLTFTTDSYCCSSFQPQVVLFSSQELQQRSAGGGGAGPVPWVQSWGRELCQDMEASRGRSSSPLHTPFLPPSALFLLLHSSLPPSPSSLLLPPSPSQ